MTEQTLIPGIETGLADLRTGALLRITTAIETAETLDELLMLALHQFNELLDIQCSGVVLVDEQIAHARLVSVYPPRVSLPGEFSLAQSVYLRPAFLQRQILQVYDVPSEIPRAQRGDYANEIFALLDHLAVRSVLMVPLVAQDKLIGSVVFATTEKPHRFTENEVGLVRLMAGQLAAAITSFRTTERAQRRTEELETLNDIAAAVTSSLDTTDIYHIVVEKLNAYFRVEAGSLLMRDEITGDLLFVMTLEGSEETLAGVRVPRGKGIVGQVAEEQKYLIVHDPQSHPQFYPKVSELVNYPTRNILCVPIVVKGRTIGVIELLNKIDGQFTEEEAQRLERMAATIGVAIENARLFQQVTTGRDRVEAILNSTNDGILMVDIDATVLTANPMAALVFNMRKEQIIGQQLPDLLTQLRSRAIEVSTPPWRDDALDVVDIELPNTQLRYVRHFILPVRDAHGAEIGKLALFQDISKERELNQLRDDYTGMLVHDLRSPLTAIMNGIMMVKRGLGGPISDQQQELLSIAHKGSQTMLEMINTLLDIAKMEQGSMSLNLEPLAPYALVDATLDRLRVSATNQSLRLEQQLEVGLPLLEADREKVVRVLQNLLDNAIKFSPMRATVVLGGSYVHLANKTPVRPPDPTFLPIGLPELPDGEWLVFWVRDQGPGIPAQYHERIFEQFGQVSGHKVRGTGLGLTFCKLAAEAHGGKIWLESTEGRGSTFAIALPVSQDLRTRKAL
jgi:two-component system, NtrC family, sensor histidine kinase KinB